MSRVACGGGWVGGIIWLPLVTALMDGTFSLSAPPSPSGSSSSDGKQSVSVTSVGAVRVLNRSRVRTLNRSRYVF